MTSAWWALLGTLSPRQIFVMIPFFFAVYLSKAKALKSGSLLWFSITNYSLIFLQGCKVKFWFVSWKSWKGLLMLPLALLTGTIFRSAIAVVQPSALFSTTLFLYRSSLLLSCAKLHNYETILLTYFWYDYWRNAWILNFKSKLNSVIHI